MTTTELPGAKADSDAHSGCAPGSNLPATIEVAHTVRASSRASKLPDTAMDAASNHTADAVSGFNFTDSQECGAPRSISAVGDSTSPPTKQSAHNQVAPAGGDSNSADDQCSDGFQRSCVDSGPTSDAATPRASDQCTTAASDSTSTGGQASAAAQVLCAPGGFLRDPVIGVLADVLDDLEKVRIANANRVRVLTKTEADDDGEMRGFGLTADHPEVKKLIMTVEAMGAAEHDAILNLQRALRKHPFNAFQKRYRGLGEKQFARLIATIGDPYWNDLHERPRTVSELWAYTGFHVVKSSGSHNALGAQKSNVAGSTSTPAATDPVNRQRSSAAGVAPKRQRGQQSNWSEDARKRAWVIAASLIKGGRMVDDKRGPQDPIADHYRVVYDEAKRKYAGSLHPAVCVRCGPAGKPAQVGSPRSDAHVHAMALRLVSKTLLKDLWLEARDLYAQNGWQ